MQNYPREGGGLLNKPNSSCWSFSWEKIQQKMRKRKKEEERRKKKSKESSRSGMSRDPLARVAILG